MSNEVSIKIDTVEGTAEEGSDYRGIHDVIKMDAYQQELAVNIEISRIFVVLNVQNYIFV